MGQYHADSSIIYTRYEILNTDQSSTTNTTEKLADVFRVRSQYRSGNIYLKIDLRKVNPVFKNLTVSGNLTMSAGSTDEKSYSIGFKLVCTSKYCANDQLEVEQEEPEDEVDSTDDSDYEDSDGDVEYEYN